MIYLIKSSGYKEEEEGKISTFFLLKIGYTEDNSKDRRFLQYKLHNPTCQVLFEIPEATEDHEKRVQYKFKNLLFEDYGREWFRYSEEIIDFFKNIKFLDELESLPKNPLKCSKDFRELKKTVRDVISYVIVIPKEKIYDGSSEDIIKEYLDKIIDRYGDSLSVELSLEYMRKDGYSDRVDKYLEVVSKRNSGVYCEDDITNQEVSKFMRIYDSYKTRYDKLKLLCEYGLSKDAIQVVLYQISDSDEIKSYYTTLGPQKLYSLGYNVTRIKKELGIVIFSEELLLDSIYSEFKEGERLSLSFIKNKLGVIYSSINYSVNPKANDIEKWFEIKEVLLSQTIDGRRKRIKAYELIKSKEQELRLELKHAQ